MYFLIITIVVHAEYRAIMGRPSVRDCTLYVTSYPCNMCAKVIVQAGIDKVVYYKESIDKISENIFDKCSVKIRLVSIMLDHN